MSLLSSEASILCKPVKLYRDRGRVVDEINWNCCRKALVFKTGVKPT